MRIEKSVSKFHSGSAKPIFSHVLKGSQMAASGSNASLRLPDHYGDHGCELNGVVVKLVTARAMESGRLLARSLFGSVYRTT
ncbi:hypothetical protein [Rhizobium leguminosarum]|uniref:hypothetical protein n=1 Tax=Rhizobium leguminosarum TaxID=384 RepID=UPI0012DAF880|nr:hypothetical protein [Rhizobium leguminosarum]